MDEIPSKAISDEVSKPRPKTTPSGYSFHGLQRTRRISEHPARLVYDLPVDNPEQFSKNPEHGSTPGNKPFFAFIAKLAIVLCANHLTQFAR